MVFSIIVPAYNIENEIEKCINSIINQSFKAIEIILINDGSCDNTGIICEKISKKDNRIRVVHKENEGLSATRNNGIDLAKGEYLIFIDGDDYIEPDSLEKFYESIKNNKHPDLLITRIKQVYSDSIKYMDENLTFAKLNTKQDYIDLIFNKSNNTWPSVRYIARKEFIKNFSLEFAEGYLHEDIDWTFNLFLYAESFAVNKHYWYNHIKTRDESITSNISGQNIIDVIELVAKNINKIKEVSLNNNTKKIMSLRLVNSLYAILNYFPKANEDEKKRIIKLLKKNNEILKHAKYFRHRLFNIFCKIFGFRISLFLMDLIHNV